MRKSYNAIIAMVIVVLGLQTENAVAQQDAQYTQYMYNTLSINPAYAGSRGGLSILGLHRSQWVGLDGAPRTQTFSIHSPVGQSERVGLGLNIVNDEIFITNETYIDIDFSYTIPTSDRGKLAFGIKGGAHLLDVNYSEASPFQNGDPLATAQDNIDNRFTPQVGVGLFYYTDKYYLGFSAPNLLRTEHFDDSNNSNDANATYLARERINYYLTSGYVFNVTEDFKFKPAGLVKWVAGAPLQVDVTANALLYDKLTLGLAYRWSASVSALAGFQITDGLMLGLAYDRETTELQQFNDGSYEIFLRFEVLNKPKRLLSPRFF
ncbi:type IX secretion system membrane protein PorP/SprF [uncultured Dokdonia sp.]|uniref:PorP/SprF family type IX secretion system membrane protein n=1 Tax=uncultured Dokdonia sp. TaxID=575653 RepID=UPI00261A6D36|nr:type IX secretion system membrane protein PorP/SprF [uncultured Dokdonia sp.]